MEIESANEGNIEKLLMENQPTPLSNFVYHQFIDTDTDTATDIDTERLVYYVSLLRFCIVDKQFNDKNRITIRFQCTKTLLV